MTGSWRLVRSQSLRFSSRPSGERIGSMPSNSRITGRLITRAGMLKGAQSSPAIKKGPLQTSRHANTHHGNLAIAANVHDGDREPQSYRIMAHSTLIHRTL